MSRPLTTADYDLPVETIKVTLHTLGVYLKTDTRSLNHASIYLLHGTGYSTHLNMTKAGITDVMGTYTVSYCSYEKSNTTVHEIRLRASANLRVKDVLELIQQNGRHKYRLAPSGVGCRFWVQTVIDDFLSAGFIHPTSTHIVKQVHDDIKLNYTVNQNSELDEITPGTFV